MEVHNTCTKATLFTHHNQQCISENKL